MKNPAFSRCPICRIPFAEAKVSGHSLVPCHPVEYVFGEIVAVSAPVAHASVDLRWTSRSTATVALAGRTLIVACYLNLGAEIPHCQCDARSIDAEILGRLVWPHPNTRVIAETALARAMGQKLRLPIDLVFADPGADYFRLRGHEAKLAPHKGRRVA